MAESTSLAALCPFSLAGTAWLRRTTRPPTTDGGTQGRRWAGWGPSVWGPCSTVWDASKGHITHSALVPTPPPLLCPAPTGDDWAGLHARAIRRQRPPEALPARMGAVRQAAGRTRAPAGSALRPHGRALPAGGRQAPACQPVAVQGALWGGWVGAWGFLGCWGGSGREA